MAELTPVFDVFFYQSDFCFGVLGHVTPVLPLVTFSKLMSQLCMCQLFLHRHFELLYAEYCIEMC